MEKTVIVSLWTGENNPVELSTQKVPESWFAEGFVVLLDSSCTTKNENKNNKHNFNEQKGSDRRHWVKVLFADQAARKRVQSSARNHRAEGASVKFDKNTPPLHLWNLLKFLVSRPKFNIFIGNHTDKGFREVSIVLRDSFGYCRLFFVNEMRKQEEKAMSKGKLQIHKVVCQRKGGSRAPPTCVRAHWGVRTLFPKKTGRKERLNELWTKPFYYKILQQK